MIQSSPFKGDAPMEVRVAVAMTLCRILISETQDHQFIELKEVGGERRFPIVIGLYEAAAIERRLKKIVDERPQTHQLLGSAIEALGGRLIKIVINDLVDHVFHAQLIIQQGERIVRVDSRPSDAIALGIFYDLPIEVAEHVLEGTSGG